LNFPSHFLAQWRRGWVADEQPPVLRAFLAVHLAAPDEAAAALPGDHLVHHLAFNQCFWPLKIYVKILNNNKKNLTLQLNYLYRQTFKKIQDFLI
jgi:hypothetical protein